MAAKKKTSATAKKAAKKTTKKATKKAPAKKATKKATKKASKKAPAKKAASKAKVKEEPKKAIAPVKKVNLKDIKIPKGLDFAPSAHPDSDLKQKQVVNLYATLLKERERVLQGLDEHLSDAISNVDPLSDEMDVAQRHTEQAYLMRFADKERKLLNQIAIALDKLRAGEYGVCEGTGEPISIKRLELRPWTRYSVEYKEQVERDRRQRQR